MSPITKLRFAASTPTCRRCRELARHERARGSRWRRYIQVWRDVDGTKPRFGVTIWASGGEVHVGRRLYRWRYRWAR